MSSRVRLNLPYPEGAEPERPPPALISELLEEIFLRVASPVDLARASVACVSFRRLIADPSFLRRYRSIHPPLLLGFVGYSGFHRLQAPHPSAALSCAVARATDFYFDYLPRPTTTEHRWIPCDVRNGRVLVRCRTKGRLGYWDLAVCDPMSRGYLLLPPITDDLIASIGLQKQNVFDTSASFVPSGGIKEDTSFSVLLWMKSGTRLGVLVFTSISGCWSVSMSTSCNDLGLNRLGVLVSDQCVNDCFYWRVYTMSTLIKLDMNTMQFCRVDLPAGHDTREIVIVESGESKVAIFSMGCKSTSVDYYTSSQNGSEKSHEWHMMSTIPLPAHYISTCYIGGPAEGHIFVECIRDGESSYSTVFSLEIKSFNVERLSRTSFRGCAYPYFGFPPSMSPRMI